MGWWGQGPLCANVNRSAWLVHFSKADTNAGHGLFGSHGRNAGLGWRGDLYCREIPAAPARSMNFCILPVAVFGNSSTKLTHCGVLKWARLLRT